MAYLIPQIMGSYCIKQLSNQKPAVIFQKFYFLFESSFGLRRYIPLRFPSKARGLFIEAPLSFMLSIYNVSRHAGFDPACRRSRKDWSPASRLAVPWVF
jgi:hypothetical protein